MEYCDVEGCNQPAHRSISYDDAIKSGLRFKTKRRRVYLCKEHYKIYKKNVKKLKRLEKWRWMG
ncbi:hypothetical protein DRN87_05275 [Candidatus Geothermarchaeota archaeon]|nr:MAG: hypothetical protein DRN87_05275 [Candidatus Geothermarchaeota archaeon]